MPALLEHSTIVLYTALAKDIPGYIKAFYYYLTHSIIHWIYSKKALKFTASTFDLQLYHIQMLLIKVHFTPSYEV
jgi:hypothetical protein